MPQDIRFPTDTFLLNEARIHDEGLNHHSLFFRTDHHWKPESGIWATRIIANLLNADCGFSFDVSSIADEHLISKIYPNWFLGSQGKKVTLSNTEPDDITLFYPDYPTELHFELKSEGIDADGDFSVLYNMNQINECDYYNKSPYHTYCYGDQALERIQNMNVKNKDHLLLIHDSFGDCVIPFLSLRCYKVDAIDLRHFDGSLKTYIEMEHPDVVLVMYNSGGLGGSVLESYGKFDFR